MTENEHPKLLIEEWFPYKEIGIECQRERGMSSALPPINFLHVWWARRPLTACKSAIIASLLPIQFDRKIFRNKFLKISKDLEENYNLIQKEKLKKKGKKIGYSGERTFKLNLSDAEEENFKTEIQKFWNKEKIRLLDPMAGGGSIPFESIRLNLDTIASDLNPIASIINYATYYYPAKYGKNLVGKITKYSQMIRETLFEQVANFVPQNDGEINDAFIWARTIKCPNPECELEVPLSPNWELSRKEKIFAVLHSPSDLNQKICQFEIVENPSEDELVKIKGTINRGVGVCPRCNSTLPGDYIKNEAQAERMGHQLFAIVYKVFIDPKQKKIERRFRIPSKVDLDAIQKVDKLIKKKIIEWKEKGILPDENFPYGCDNRPIYYGTDKWYKFFNNRQLLANMTILEGIIKLKKELIKRNKLPLEEIRAIITYLQFALDKVIDYNCISSIWQGSYQRIIHLFNRHDFSFNWSYAEMDIIRKGFDWAISNVLKSYNGLVNLLGDSKSEITIKSSPAQNLNYIENSFIDVIIVDPPYYNNVMYAELSDFFYVWMKKSLGDLYPDLFTSTLTDKDNEAVANSSKFEGMGQSKKILAKQDYEAKMRDSFIEMHRVLQKHGVLTIMFTHKATDAWDTLAMSLMEAGFEITASWPVHTESRISLNIAKKNAVKSTIFLVCRKRLKKNQDVWWEDDVLPEIKKIVKEKARKFEKEGISGVDLFISSFGPALNEFSKYYPVKDIEGNEIRAEKALQVAREIVTEIVLKRILKGSINIDLISKYYIVAWEIYRARIIPFDEARNLAISIGINIDDLKSKKLLKRKSGDVEILSPSEREKIGAINIENPDDKGILINAVQIAMLAYQDGGQKEFERVVAKMRRDTDKSFRQYMEALYNILPEVKDLEEKKTLAQILVSTEEKIIPKGGKLDDYM